MQIVIDIPDAMYKDIKSGKDGYSNYVHTAIRNGKALPKNHGRLIDADDIPLIDEEFYTPSDYWVAEEAVREAPTVIEAEK